MALPIAKFLEDVREAVANFKAIHEAIFEYFSLKNKTLLELSSDWTSETKTVPNITKYKRILVYPYNSTSYNGVVLEKLSDTVFAGGGFVQGTSSTLAVHVEFQFRLTVSNEAVTIAGANYGVHYCNNGSHANGSGFIRKIVGLDPEIPDALKNILGGGVLTSLISHLQRRWAVC